MVLWFKFVSCSSFKIGWFRFHRASCIWKYRMIRWHLAVVPPKKRPPSSARRAERRSSCAYALPRRNGKRPRRRLWSPRSMCASLVRHSVRYDLALSFCALLCTSLVVVFSCLFFSRPGAADRRIGQGSRGGSPSPGSRGQRPCLLPDGGGEQPPLLVHQRGSR
jgi:hypothetical protein